MFDPKGEVAAFNTKWICRENIYLSRRSLYLFKIYNLKENVQTKISLTCHTNCTLVSIQIYKLSIFKYAVFIPEHAMHMLRSDNIGIEMGQAKCINQSISILNGYITL